MRVPHSKDDHARLITHHLPWRRELDVRCRTRPDRRSHSWWPVLHPDLAAPAYSGASPCVWSTDEPEGANSQSTRRGPKRRCWGIISVLARDFLAHSQLSLASSNKAADLPSL